MDTLFLSVLGLILLAFLTWRATRIGIDAGQHGFDWAHRLRWALLGTLSPAWYWWGARIERLTGDEQSDLLTRETAALELERADSLRCPLCGAEIPAAWALTPGGSPTVAPGPVACPRCDFRLDACRHCGRFLPGAPKRWGELRWGDNDMTFGRCSHYKKSRSVDEIYSPEMARQLKARGWQRVRAPLSVTDSLVPPDFCTAFVPSRKRLRADRVRWPDARRAALLRLLSSPRRPETTSEEAFASSDEQWLL